MTSNLLNIKSKQNSKQPSCKGRTRRRTHCPVRERTVTEYLFDSRDIERDTKEGQARIQDCSQGHISELAEQLEQEGQSTGGHLTAHVMWLYGVITVIGHARYCSPGARPLES